MSLSISIYFNWCTFHTLYTHIKVKLHTFYRIDALQSIFVFLIQPKLQGDHKVLLNLYEEFFCCPIASYVTLLRYGNVKRYIRVVMRSVVWCECKDGQHKDIKRANSLEVTSSTKRRTLFRLNKNLDQTPVEYALYAASFCV